MLRIRWRATAGFRANTKHKMEVNGRIQSQYQAYDGGQRQDAGPMLSIRWRATAGFRANAKHKMEGNSRIQGQC